MGDFLATSCTKQHQLALHRYNCTGFEVLVLHTAVCLHHSIETAWQVFKRAKRSSHKADTNSLPQTNQWTKTMYANTLLSQKHLTSQKATNAPPVSNSTTIPGTVCPETPARLCSCSLPAKRNKKTRTESKEQTWGDCHSVTQHDTWSKTETTPLHTKKLSTRTN